ncbi:hypothetical protein BDM02DRAFT_1316900 [Thelephora ganbajun]|uniref:Uncharacterized protein n=1 Tax=Thelephora ganbajun TaxID=370292 RepID=A0ACB6Z2S7_THEGA|nr:hypothetical protein BDM02DRAFT_1316900 [Thelephora ganbajun]
MFHMRKLSNTRSTPIGSSHKPTKIRDTTPTSNHTSSISTGKPPKSSTKSFHRRAQSSIDKSQVSKPFPILTHDERDLFGIMASGNVQTRARRIPKVAEKKVNIDAPELIKSSPQHKPKVSTDVPSRSWYTSVPVQSPVKGTLQRSISNATPRTTPSKVDVGRANSTKESRSHGRVESEARRDGVEPMKQHVHKGSITHTDCPWVEATSNPIAHPEYLARHQPARSTTRGSCESDKTAIEDEAATRVDAKKGEEASPLVKSVQETLRPTVRLVSKPLPDLPAFDSLSSRWSASTGSVYSDDNPFSYGNILTMFPDPPKNMPDIAPFNDWENTISLSTPPVFMSCPNHSSGSVSTVTLTITPDPPPVKPLMLKAVTKPKIATVVHQNPRASYSYNQLQDSIATRDDRAYPQASMKGSIHNSSVRTAGPALTLRQRSSSFGSSNCRNPPNRIVNIEALLWPHRRQTPEDIERIERERLEREREYELEVQKEQELKQFEMEFGYNPWYKGKKMYQREVDPNGFELIRPEKKQRNWL